MTGSPPVASVRSFPCRSVIFLTLPEVLWMTTISQICSVPVIISNEVITHCLLFLFASTTTPTAALAGLHLCSRSSYWSSIASKRSSMPCPVIAEHGINIMSPHRSSGCSHCAASCPLISSILLVHKSIFVIATIIGTPASLAWFIASIVCGLIPSSAATTMTTISVILAHLALSDVNSSCQGVSINVIFCSLCTIWEAQIDCVIPPASSPIIFVCLR